MKPATVRLIDIGLAQDFSSTTSFADSVVTALTSRRGDHPFAEVEFIRTRDIETIQTALVAEAAVIHLVAHGETERDSLGFVSDDETTVFELSEFSAQLDVWGQGVVAGTLFADCCDTGQARFVRAIRECLAQPICYIGSSRGTNWYESTVFASAFYGARFRTKGRGLSEVERGLEAGRRATEAYEAVAGVCPFKVTRLEPSRSAMRRLG